MQAIDCLFGSENSGGLTSYCLDFKIFFNMYLRFSTSRQPFAVTKIPGSVVRISYHKWYLIYFSVKLTQLPLDAPEKIHSFFMAPWQLLIPHS